MVGLPDFRFQSKSGLFATQTVFDHLKSRLVQISGFQISIVPTLLNNPNDLIILIIFNFETGLWPTSVLLVNQRKLRKPGITIFTQQARSRTILFLYISTRLQSLLVYLLVNSILKIIEHLQMLYSELEDQQAAPPT